GSTLAARSCLSVGHTRCHYRESLLGLPLVVLFFFFQAEDGIRDATVTGVHVCSSDLLKLSPEPEQTRSTVSRGCRATICSASRRALSSAPQYTRAAPAACVMATVPLVVE